jgi:succinate dehydrogenase / fumarate reductase flavoprotein subunit
MMQERVGIVRTEADMVAAVAAIGELRAREASVGVCGGRAYNPGWHTALDLRNLLTISEAVSRAALERKESRGAQFREDHPNKDPALGKVNVVVRKGKDGGMIAERRPLQPVPPELQAIIDEMG